MLNASHPRPDVATRRSAGPAFLDGLPRFVFFTGKGGVGKTSVACATAVTLAERGNRVLLVSTDPASNVGQVFGQPIGHVVTPLASAPGVDALEIDPEAAAEQYREAIIGPVRNLLPAQEIASMTEQLSGSCTTEIASFNEFTDLLADPALTAAYDHVVFDTAPTGHTIRLLQLPGDWTKFIDDGAGDASCLGPMSGLDKRREVYRAAVDALAAPEVTRLVLVARAQASTLAEVERTRTELQGVGLANQHLVINAVMPETGDGDPLVAAVRSREQHAIAGMPAGVAALPRDVIALRPWNIMGVANLHEMFRGGPPIATPAAPGEHGDASPGQRPSLGALVDSLEEQGHGLVMFMGKGGVGKTTMAHAVALALAERGHDVLLTSTDPAGGVGSESFEQFPNLTVERIDPQAALADYTDDVLRSKGSRLDAAGRQQLLEDLRSPCTEEVAVFRQFSAAIRQARRKFVIMDTAPTGHTLLLLDATGSYHRDVVRQLGAAAHVTTPMMLLQDPGFTRLCIVTLPESTPVLEAEQLQADLARAGIRPWAWVVNNSVAAAAPESPFLRAIAANESEQIERVRSLAERLALVPLLARAPVEAADLLRLSAKP